MSQDNINLLREEIENLRKENLHLKTALKVKKVEGENGQSVFSQEKIDSTVIALSRQLEELKEFNTSMKKTLEVSSQVEESLEALVPALEVQIRGYKSEIDQLAISTEDTADTYAGVVSNLETQIKQLREDFAKKEENLNNKYQADIEALEAKIEILDQKVSIQSTPESDRSEIPQKSDKTQTSGPFTSLSIYMDQE